MWRLTEVARSGIFTPMDEYKSDMNEQQLDGILAALADPTRRAILRRLSEGEARVTEVAQPFDISLNSVSKHIRVLERAALVRRRVVGREHLLSLNPEPLDEAGAWIAAQREAWTARLAALDVLLRDDERHVPSIERDERDGERTDDD